MTDHRQVTVTLDREEAKRRLHQIEAALEQLGREEESMAPNAGAALFAERDALRTALQEDEGEGSCTCGVASTGAPGTWPCPTHGTSGPLAQPSGEEGEGEAPRRWKLWRIERGDGAEVWMGAKGPATNPPADCGLTGTAWVDAATVEVVEILPEPERVERIADLLFDAVSLVDEDERPAPREHYLDLARSVVSLPAHRHDQEAPQGDVPEWAKFSRACSIRGHDECDGKAAPPAEDFDCICSCHDQEAPQVSSGGWEPWRTDDSVIEGICAAFHDEYEGHAAEVGWETQESTRVAFKDLPEENRAAMVGTVRALLERHVIYADKPSTLTDEERERLLEIALRISCRAVPFDDGEVERVVDFLRTLAGKEQR